MQIDTDASGTISKLEFLAAMKERNLILLQPPTPSWKLTPTLSFEL